MRFATPVAPARDSMPRPWQKSIKPCIAGQPGPPEKDNIMAKSQKKSSRETRKPKAEKPTKPNASQPSQKTGVVVGLDNMKK